MHTPRMYPGPIRRATIAENGDLILDPAHARCKLCGRPLDVAGDAMSTDCGGDCWGCMGKIEADSGSAESACKVAQEIGAGLRDRGGEPTNWT